VKIAGALLALLACDAVAATAYVTDELVTGVYADAKTQGQRLVTLHSGAAVETLAIAGDATQVRLADGTTGWVKSAYLTPSEPAKARIRELQDELDRTRATVPAMAAAADRSELARLTRELERRDAASTAAPAAGPLPAASALALCSATAVVSLVSGFALGYAWLARRIRAKFGGIKVY
jgi:hypothetical protein